jgi:hypothetical protein
MKMFCLKVFAVLVCLAAAAAFPNALSAACGLFASHDKIATQSSLKAFISWNPETKIESITLQPRIEGTAAEFTLLIATPSKPTVEDGPPDIFKDLAVYSQLMPLPQPIATGLEAAIPAGTAKIETGSVRFGPSSKDPRKVGAQEPLAGKIKFQIYGPDETASMFDQLKNKSYPAAGDPGLRDYAKKKWFFALATIDAQQLNKVDGRISGEIAPIRVTFSSEQCVFPIRILQASVKEKLDLLLYVQAPQQMDAGGDAAWTPSHRLRQLTSMLGTGATQEHLQELQRRTQWITQKLQDDRGFQPSRLEFARRFEDADVELFDDPVRYFSRPLTGDLPPGASIVSTEQFIKEVREEYESKNGPLNEAARKQLQKLEERYAAGSGLIAKMDPKLVGKGFIFSRYMWYAGREISEADAADVKNITRLKGVLQSGAWLIKIQKVLRPQDTNEDWIFLPVEKEHPLVRALPTSQ